MKRTKFSESQIASILNEGASGVSVPELCRKHGMSSASYYKWRSQFSGMDAAHMKQLRELQSENARLKKLYAEALLHTDIIKEALAKK